MYLKKLKTLEEKLVSAKEFPPVFEYFLDNFAEDLRFLDLGQPTRHPLLEALLEAIGETIFHKKTSLERLMLIKVPKGKFIHGACIMHGKMTTVFYFEEIDMGLAVVSMGGTQDTQFSRFSAKQLPLDSLMGKN